MELINILRVLRRWLWLIVVVVGVTELALWLGTQASEPTYVTSVRLQISTPQREDVAAYGEYRSISLRDEVTVAINNFSEMLQSGEVREMTTSRLGLDGDDALYGVEVTRLADADYVTVYIEARSPALAAEIANAHVDIAIDYYGELRAQSIRAEKELFAEQLRLAEEEYQSAEMALADFRTRNGIYSLESQLATQERLLEQLQLERDQRWLEQATTVITTTDDSIPVTPTSVVDPVEEVDKLIAQRLKELEHFASLAPQYNLLTENVEQASAGYQHLLAKYNEADVKVTAVQAANFIQVIKPASPPIGSESNWPELAVLSFAGSLGLGVMLAFLFQYISNFRNDNFTDPQVSEKKSSPRISKRKVMKSQVTKNNEENQKAPSRVHLILEFLNGLKNRFRRNISSHELENEAPSSEHNAEQANLDSQDQHTSKGKNNTQAEIEAKSIEEAEVVAKARSDTKSNATAHEAESVREAETETA